MKNNLKFFIINDSYIDYLSEFDNHIAYNKNSTRPYIGIVLKVNDLSYFAPMYSPKPQHQKYRDNLTFFKMYSNKNKSNYLGLIRFSDMIPISDNYLIPIDVGVKKIFEIITHPKSFYF